MKSCGILFAVDFLGRSRMKKIWWNNFWYLYPDINYVIDGTKILKNIRRRLIWIILNGHIVLLSGLEDKNFNCGSL